MSGILRGRVSRREFLGLGAVGLVSAGVPALSSCGDDLPEIKEGKAIAKEGELEPNSALLFADADSGKPRVLIRLGDGGYVMYSAECTHQGCTVSYKSDDGGYLACPCHNSVYDPRDGAVWSGPADEPLPKLGLEIREGKIFSA